MAEVIDCACHPRAVSVTLVEKRSPVAVFFCSSYLCAFSSRALDYHAPSTYEFTERSPGSPLGQPSSLSLWHKGYPGSSSLGTPTERTSHGGRRYTEEDTDSGTDPGNDTTEDPRRHWQLAMMLTSLTALATSPLMSHPTVFSTPLTEPALAPPLPKPVHLVLILILISLRHLGLTVSLPVTPTETPISPSTEASLSPAHTEPSPPLPLKRCSPISWDLRRQIERGEFIEITELLGEITVAGGAGVLPRSTKRRVAPIASLQSCLARNRRTVNLTECVQNLFQDLR